MKLNLSQEPKTPNDRLIEESVDNDNSFEQSRTLAIDKALEQARASLRYIE